MPSLTTTDWILIGGFFLIAYGLQQIISLLKDIHAELMNIESHVQPNEPSSEN